MWKWEYKALEYSKEAVVEHDPTLLPDAITCTGRIARAVRDNELIALLGDYDSDGMNSCNILQRSIRDVGGKCNAYIPEREEGYGANAIQVNRAVKDGATLIIMVDNGSSQFSAINRCEELGVDLIIIDHHNIPDQSKIKAIAFVNPKRNDSIYPFKDVCATLLTWKIAQLIYDYFGFPEGYAHDRFLDLVAVGTLGDQMPIIGENRRIVIDGLKKANDEPSLHLKALGKALDVDHFDTFSVLFQIVPSINSASRLGVAKESYFFLHQDGKIEISEEAKNLRLRNDERKELKNNIINNMVLQKDDFPVVYYHSENIDHGLLGIIASHLVETYKKPALVSTLDEKGRIKGSGRSICGFKLYNYLMSIPDDFFVNRGGHDEAVGFEIIPSEHDSFKEYFYNTNPIVDEFVIYYNDKLIDVESQYSIVKANEPYGLQHEMPLFLVEDLEINYKKYYSSSNMCYGNGFLGSGKLVEFALKGDCYKGNLIKGVAHLKEDKRGNVKINFVDYEILNK